MYYKTLTAALLGAALRIAASKSPLTRSLKPR